MDDPGSALRAAVAHAVRHLRTISDPLASTPGAPGKWSPKEVIGHLIDSASNNHQRFVRAQLPGAVPFDGYAQDDWVRLQRYNEADWSALVDLWAAFNLHLARVMEHTSEEGSRRPRPDLQLTRLAFRQANEPVSLGWFMEDYVEHMQHHLRQIGPGFATD
jgi:hypothetical protein